MEWRNTEKERHNESDLEKEGILVSSCARADVALENKFCKICNGKPKALRGSKSSIGRG